jgi:hypothetical protein
MKHLFVGLYFIAGGYGSSPYSYEGTINVMRSRVNRTRLSVTKAIILAAI